MNNEFNDLNNQSLNKSNENINKYRSIINKDTIVLLVLSIITIIVGIIFSDDGVELFLRAFLYLILLVIMVINRKEIKSFIGSFAIVISCLMIMLSIIGRSLFDIAFLVLAIFYMIHSINYLKAFKSQSVQVFNYENDNVKNNKTNYFRLSSLILIILSPFVSILYMFLNSKTSVDDISDIKIHITVFGIFFVMQLISLILCVISHMRKEKSTLLYICMVISMLSVLISGLVIIKGYENLKSTKNYYGSDEYKTRVFTELEEDFEYDINQELFYSYDNYIDVPGYDETLIFTKSDYEQLLEKKTNNKTSVFADYDYCDGYVTIQKNKIEVIDSKNAKVNAYLKCKGDNPYTSEGYDETKLKNVYVPIENRKYDITFIDSTSAEYDSSECDSSINTHQKFVIENGKLFISEINNNTKIESNVITSADQVFKLNKSSSCNLFTYIILSRGDIYYTTEDVSKITNVNYFNQYDTFEQIYYFSKNADIDDSTFVKIGYGKEKGCSECNYRLFGQTKSGKTIYFTNLYKGIEISNN